MGNRQTSNSGKLFTIQDLLYRLITLQVDSASSLPGAVNNVRLIILQQPGIPHPE
jgi:hypothetical protein